MYKNVHKLATAAMILVIATAAFGQSEMRTNEMSKKAQTVVTVREGQSIKFTVDDPNKTGVITVTNPTDLVGDADLVAKDKDNVEIVRESVEIEPNANTPVTIQKVFPDLDLAGVSVDIGVSLRARSVDVSEARTLPIDFKSQRDSRWKNEKMGRSGLTIGGYGCAMTSVAMAGSAKMTGLTPSTLNTWLSANSGYTSDGLLYWGKPPGFQPSSGFRYVGTGVGTVKNAANLKSLIDGGNYVVAFSYRFSTHWVVIYKYSGDGSRLSQYEYLDPYDLSYALRKVDDGNVKAASRIQIYK